MKSNTPITPLDRHNQFIKEKVHDTYKLRGKLTEPTRCPQCNAVYHKGRWSWNTVSSTNVAEKLCSACHRINDHYPAGEIILSGSFLVRQKEDIIKLARTLEKTENAEHPLNRIIEIRDVNDSMLITTTDVHLPRRIGKAIQQAWKGKLGVHFDEEGYFARITWHRDD